MRCSNCGAENPVGKKFCGDCGAPLANLCPKCGADNPVSKRFCSDCGAEFAPGASAACSAPPVPPAAEIPSSTGKSDAVIAADGERRHLTVLFSDLVGSTEIAAHLDAEDWREIVAHYQRTTATAVMGLGGHVAEYLGDGVVVYFGWPEAHEDDAERAIRAGLAIIDAMKILNARLSQDQRIRLSIRVGIDAGSVVVGRGGGDAARIFGQTPNIAARVQTLAEPDSVLITAAVHELASGLFVIQDRGAQQLKGIEYPVKLYRAIQPAAAGRRMRGSAVPASTPFVGRKDEMRLLLSRWERVREGRGQLVLVVGEPGIGKSRLIREFRSSITGGPHLWVECVCQQLFQDTPFQGVTQILGQGLGWRDDESPEERVVRLENSLGLAGLKVSEAVPLVVEMLNLPNPQKYPQLMFAPDQRRKRLLANLAAWVLNVSRIEPMIIAMEDLHWVDPSTLELIQTLVEQAATAPLMLLCTGRPEFRAPWPMRSHHAQLTLDRLNNRHTREMVAGVVASSALGSELIDEVVKRTDGVPLFAEELTRLILDGTRSTVAHEIPTTLQDSLAARLDRLGPAKEVAQVASVIGREFSYELLKAVSSLSEDELQSALSKLADAELIYVRGLVPDATYQFKHALVQDAAYEALLKIRRRELHRRVAHTLTERFVAIAEEHPEVIASHFREAGEVEPAISAWKKAGEAACGRRAFKEAERSYQQALALLSAQPESTEHDASRLELASALFQVLFVTKGYTAPETVEAATLARTLAEKAGNLALLVRQVYATWAAVHNSGDHSGAAALADQLLNLAQREGSPASLGFAHMAQAETCYYLGKLIKAEEHIASLSPSMEDSGFKQFPGIFVIVMGFVAINSWTLGRPASALEPVARAVAFGHKSHNPYDLALARFFESWLYLFLRDPHRAAGSSAESMAISEEHDLSYSRHLAHVITGCARAHLGSAHEGVALIKHGLSGLNKIGGRLGFTNLLTLLAEAQALDGDTADALNTLNDALQANPEEIVFHPSILACRGELRLAIGQTDLAEADFREAMALAQTMSAKAWELRAAIGLGRLLRTRGDRAAVRDFLAPIYDWFTEGFDTADLKAAKALLDELSA